ncbi:toll/interleukin-1 receptor domain-containing protein [[Clostridium] fimetarium]|uniref:TIR domain-containing protein n=1 Tax=[Clostridium] fimetarium TaxID=99656 RepID=A0A1I0MWU0_9FIRM|nr:toll/interleukin-1 receptor domain-containing protein [[Clostridium] fimetarium]SEV93368.1 TIR domain-containing protein [[Clostridium] fimetarium]
MNKLVFISHNHFNKEIAREIGLLFAAQNINVWFDEWNIAPGESIPSKVNNGLEICTHFLLLWSEKASKAPWVKAETNAIIGRMLSTDGVKFIPVMLDSTPLPTIISSYKYIKYGSGTEKDKSKIVQSVTGKEPTMNFSRAIVKKYNEVVFDAGNDDAFNIKVCPQCGEDTVKQQRFTDYEHDENYYSISCKSCGWSEWTQ